MLALYHLRADGEAEAPIAPAEGEAFVHLCTEAQLGGVRERFFKGRAVTAYQIDPAALDPNKLREEDSYGHGLFPHYYGEIPSRAIVGARRYPI